MLNANIGQKAPRRASRAHGGLQGTFVVVRLFFVITTLTLIFTGCLSSRPFKQDNPATDYMQKLARLKAKGYQDAEATLMILNDEKAILAYDEKLGVPQPEFFRAELFLKRTFPLLFRRAPEEIRGDSKLKVIINKILFDKTLTLDEFCYADGQASVNQLCRGRFLRVASFGKAWNDPLRRSKSIVKEFEDLETAEQIEIIDKHNPKIEYAQLSILHAENFVNTKALSVMYGWKNVKRLSYYFETEYIGPEKIDIFCLTTVVLEDCKQVLSGIFTKYKHLKLTGTELEYAYATAFPEKGFGLMQNRFKRTMDYSPEDETDSYTAKHFSTWMIEILRGCIHENKDIDCTKSYEANKMIGEKR